jgi:hypothetical protein
VGQHRGVDDKARDEDNDPAEDSNKLAIREFHDALLSLI